MTTIPKKVREEAADLCAMLASWPSAISVKTMSERVYGEEINKISRLAVRAWDAASRSHILGGRGVTDAAAVRDDYAEAEALLRCGWSPT